MTDEWSQDLEQGAWEELERLRRDWLKRCDGGSGTPALRVAAEVLREAQAVLERERGFRQLRDAWDERRS